jgi:hypothetical protein
MLFQFHVFFSFFPELYQPTVHLHLSYHFLNYLLLLSMLMAPFLRSSQQNIPLCLPLGKTVLVDICLLLVSLISNFPSFFHRIFKLMLHHFFYYYLSLNKLEFSRLTLSFIPTIETACILQIGIFYVSLVWLHFLSFSESIQV